MVKTAKTEKMVKTAKMAKMVKTENVVTHIRLDHIQDQLDVMAQLEDAVLRVILDTSVTLENAGLLDQLEIWVSYRTTWWTNWRSRTDR
jgi:hypothetical protein